MQFSDEYVDISWENNFLLTVVVRLHSNGISGRVRVINKRQYK